MLKKLLLVIALIFVFSMVLNAVELKTEQKVKQEQLIRWQRLK